MPRGPRHLPSDPLPGRLAAGLAKIAVALRHHAWRRETPRGLTPTQAQIVATLRAGPPAGLRVSEIAERLAVTAPTASDAVAALERKGLVERRGAADDRRARLVSLTDAGRSHAEASVGWPDFLASAVDALDPSEQRALLRSLVKLIRTLQVRGQIPVARMCVGCRFFRPNVHADPARPHHCAYVDAAFGDAQIRLDCPDHEPAPPEEAERIFAAYCGGSGKETP